MKPPKQIEHIGIAVTDLNQSVEFYTNFLGFKLLGFEHIESEKVRVAFLEIGETRLELLEATSSDSPINHFIEKRGEGIHHIAFQVDNVVERLNFLKEQGIKLIHEIPKEGAHGNLVAFLNPKSTNGVLLEFCQPRLTDNEENH
ncbi:MULTISPECIES: methylmalonyl-CoA epimerase [unclassified Bacillus (in: firmicutes)]|uniref:methylmalonyl-CoA epimerase n=1 Tax=unclassified Bacillus (in: firmicutes) TaxID=185979 RepID=UPI001BE9440D|nr:MULTISPECIES: methylmalonyl-CoA epimerase [unclassified Bacillus (in: firmicutes)]MBT2617236.1 methylmalonyl-CoA epimerase [Bacillus sp. ISL-78]MBT2627829.1 methylmalonyl-CoA epimerase [Bacillus sp. ISL-101]